MTAEDPFDLQRFVAAQDRGGTYENALGELCSGAKTSHWMWFVFPQVSGLGSSEVSRAYSIASLAEARAYLAHCVLGPRLIECARALLSHEGKSAEQIFGVADAMKLRSSMSLFLRAEPAEAVFTLVLERYFAGRTDPATDARI